MFFSAVFFDTSSVDVPVPEETVPSFVYATTNYSGTYSLVSLYDNNEMTTVNLDMPGYFMELSPSLDEDDPNDDKDLYNMVLSNGGDDKLIVAQMTVRGDMWEDPGLRTTDEIVGVNVLSTTIPSSTVQSEDEWSVVEALYFLVPSLSQIRFYDSVQTELALGGRPGSIQMRRAPV